MRVAIIMLGPPGAGKGTQARMLSEALGFAHISTGDMLRAAIKDETELGLRVKTFIESGRFAPDEVVDAIVRERVQQADCARGYILDGYPRTLPQADTLQLLFANDGIGSFTLGITVRDEVLIERLASRWTCPNCNKTFSLHLSSGSLPAMCDKCHIALLQRHDDTVEVVRERLRVYRERTEPLIEYYRKRGTYVPIDGEQVAAKVFYAIRAEVKNRTDATSEKNSLRPE